MWWLKDTKRSTRGPNEVIIREIIIIIIINQTQLTHSGICSRARTHSHIWDWVTIPHHLLRVWVRSGYIHSHFHRICFQPDWPSRSTASKFTFWQRIHYNNNNNRTTAARIDPEEKHILCSLNGLRYGSRTVHVISHSFLSPYISFARARFCRRYCEHTCIWHRHIDALFSFSLFGIEYVKCGV